MPDNLAKIRGKGCQSTGITEEIARKFHDELGKSVMAIVELKSTSRTEDSDGQETVSLTILSVEPALDPAASDHLRELQRVLWRNRAEADGQAVIDEQLGDVPRIGDILDQGLALLRDEDDE